MKSQSNQMKKEEQTTQSENTMSGSFNCYLIELQEINIWYFRTKKPRGLLWDISSKILKILFFEEQIFDTGL